MSGVAIAQVTPSPYKIANRLAKEFNSYYTATSPDGKTLYPVVQCEDPATRVLRVSLLRMIETALENGLRMLGIRTLQEM